MALPGTEAENWVRATERAAAAGIGGEARSTLVVAGISLYIGPFSHCCGKNPDKAASGRGLLAHRLRTQHSAIQWGRQQEPEAAGGIASSQEVERRNAGAQRTFFLFRVGPQPMGAVAYSWYRSLPFNEPSLETSSQTHPDVCLCSPYSSLSLIGLTIKTNNHTDPLAKELLPLNYLPLLKSQRAEIPP